jgi:predicted tellurium resistance membrane protein TerC
MYDKVEGEPEEDIQGWFSGLPGIIVQIMILDIIFSLDSVITAVGMAEDIEVMVAAVVIAIGVMLLFAKQIGDFVNKYPSMKILALSFLLLIGVLLTAEGLGQHINKGYIYFAMAFALMVELLNIRFRAKQGAA